MRNASANSTAVVGENGTATVTATIFYDNDQDIDVNDTSSVTLDWVIIYESKNDSGETFTLTNGSFSAAIIQVLFVSPMLCIPLYYRL